MASCAI